MVEEAGRQTVLLPGDLATEAGCKAAVQGCVDKFGRIDILVNNASVQVGCKTVFITCASCLVYVLP